MYERLKNRHEQKRLKLPNSYMKQFKVMKPQIAPYLREKRGQQMKNIITADSNEIKAFINDHFSHFTKDKLHSSFETASLMHNNVTEADRQSGQESNTVRKTIMMNEKDTSNSNFIELVKEGQKETVVKESERAKGGSMSAVTNERSSKAPHRVFSVPEEVEQRFKISTKNQGLSAQNSLSSNQQQKLFVSYGSAEQPPSTGNQTFTFQGKQNQINQVNFETTDDNSDILASKARRGKPSQSRQSKSRMCQQRTQCVTQIEHQMPNIVTSLQEPHDIRALTNELEQMHIKNQVHSLRYSQHQIKQYKKR